MEKEQREMGHAASTIDALSSRRHLLAVKTFFWLLGVDSQKHLARLYVKSALVFWVFLLNWSLFTCCKLQHLTVLFIKSTGVYTKWGDHTVYRFLLCVCAWRINVIYSSGCLKKDFQGNHFGDLMGQFGNRGHYHVAGRVIYLHLQCHSGFWQTLNLLPGHLILCSFYFPFIITCVCGCNVQCTAKKNSAGRNIQIFY